MMKKTKIAMNISKILIAVGVCALLSCGKNLFSSSTDVGQNIVDDFNPSVINVNSNIKTFSGSAVIDSSYSMRDVGDSILFWSHRLQSALSVGIFSGVQEGDTAFQETSYAYIEFRPGLLRQSGYESDRKNLKSAYSIDSVVFTINRLRLNIGADSVGRMAAGRTASVDVYACDTLKDTAAFAFHKTQIHGPALGNFKASLDSGVSTDTIYTVKLDTSYISRFKSAVSDSSVHSADTGWFAFCLKPGLATSEVVRLDNGYDIPRIKVYFRSKSTDSGTAYVTLNRYNDATYTVFEQDSTRACGHPFSSWGSGRRAVFKLGVSSLRDFMDTAAGPGKKFVVIQRADLALRLSQIVSDLYVDSVAVLYCISSTPLSTMDNFTQVSSFYAHMGIGDTSYILPAASWFQKAIVKQNSDTVYLYLTIPAQAHSYSPPFIQLDWSQKQAHLDLNAIVTNPR
jgi:hypothetical protein